MSIATSKRNCWPTYHLLITLSLALTAGRIAVVSSPEGDTAFLSANDRSRWATVATLVERGTYEIDQQISIVNPIKRNRRPWNTIDKVKHLGKDGKQHHYSSKPPLLATVVAGLYYVARGVTGMTLSEQPIYMARMLLIFFNLPLLAVFFYTTIATIDRLISTQWAKTASAASVCFGTMVLPFSISLNNHLPACVATAIAMWIYFRAVNHQLKSDPTDDEPEPTLLKPLVDGDEAKVSSGIAEHETKNPPSQLSFGWALLAGMAAATAAANELPALSMTVLWAVLFFLAEKSSWLPFSIGVTLVAIAFFGTNWMAHDNWRPPYAHRGNGQLIEEFNASLSQPDDAMKRELQETLKREGEFDRIGSSISQTISLSESDEKGRWLVKNGEIQYALLQGDPQWQLRHWDDWYEYSGTYWRDGNRRGVDRGEASKTTYLFNLTLGHHGVFSLTPLWLLLPAGWIIGLLNPAASIKRFHVAVLLASAVCFLFYLNRPLIDRNYGGVSVCFRWLLWFAPLWLITIAPVMDRCSAWRATRIPVYLMLALSLFSVSTALQTPWQSPWLYRFWTFLGWLDV